ncbi:MAG: hypothetical protein KC502_14195 [Myxococcales bacterium]|nr:hypothetical protein [Myxococcales bacterium]
MQSRLTFIRRVELLHIVLGALVLGLALVMGTRPQWIGVGAGALLATANFRAMATLLSKFTTGGTGAQSAAVGLLMVKLLVLALAVFAILTLLSPDVAAFAVGLTVTPVSLLLVSALGRPVVNPEAH